MSRMAKQYRSARKWLEKALEEVEEPEEYVETLVEKTTEILDQCLESGSVKCDNLVDYIKETFIDDYLERGGDLENWEDAWAYLSAGYPVKLEVYDPRTGRSFELRFFSVESAKETAYEIMKYGVRPTRIVDEETGEEYEVGEEVFEK